MFIVCFKLFIWLKKRRRRTWCLRNSAILDYILLQIHRFEVLPEISSTVLPTKFVTFIWYVFFLSWSFSFITNFGWGREFVDPWYFSALTSNGVNVSSPLDLIFHWAWQGPGFDVISTVKHKHSIPPVKFFSERMYTFGTSIKIIKYCVRV